MRMECERQVNSGKNALIKCENVGKMNLWLYSGRRSAARQHC